MNRPRTLAAIAALAIVATACGGGDDGDNADDGAAGSTVATTTPAPTTASTSPADSPTTTADDATTPSTSAATDETPRTVTHSLGTIDVVPDPTRVVALDRSLIDAALALELPLAGYTTFSDPNGELPEYFGDALAFAEGATWVGDLLEPNLEAIAAVGPDLILMTAVRHEDLYDELSAIAPTVATDSAGGGWKDNIELVAAVTDRTALADEVLGAYEERAAAVGADIVATADDPTISVVRFADAIRLYQPVSFSGVVLEDAGLSRPESQQDREDFIQIISEEELGLADADVLIYTIANHEAVEKMAEGVRSRALWSTLTAVQSGNAHAVLDDSWMSGVGVFGAHLILDDLAEIFGVDPHLTTTQQEQP